MHHYSGICFAQHTNEIRKKIWKRRAEFGSVMNLRAVRRRAFGSWLLSLSSKESMSKRRSKFPGMSSTSPLKVINDNRLVSGASELHYTQQR